MGNRIFPRRWSCECRTRAAEWLIGRVWWVRDKITLRYNRIHMRVALVGEFLVTPVLVTKNFTNTLCNPVLVHWGEPDFNSFLIYGSGGQGHVTQSTPVPSLPPHPPKVLHRLELGSLVLVADLQPWLYQSKLGIWSGSRRRVIRFFRWTQMLTFWVLRLKIPVSSRQQSSDMTRQSAASPPSEGSEKRTPHPPP